MFRFAILQPDSNYFNFIGESMDLVERFAGIIDFLALYLGSDSEISLCDQTTILYIRNPQSPDHAVGMPIGDMQHSFLENPEYHKAPSNVNYRALSKKGEKLRSATMFIREGEQLIGMLTINSRVDDLILCRSLIDRLIQGDHVPVSDEKRAGTGASQSTVKGKSKAKKPKDYYETLSMSVSDVIDDTIQQATAKFNTSPLRFNAREKMSVVQELDDRGVFLVKGSVSEVAKRLNTSDATVYRYLQSFQQ